MTLKTNREIERFDRVISELDSKSRVAVIHHTDPDGVCSGVLCAQMIRRVRGSPIELRHNQRANEIALTAQTVDLLKQKKITHVFITDMAADEGPDQIKQVERFAKVIILDHHPKMPGVSSQKTIVVKAKDIAQIPPQHYATAKMVYDLGSRHTDMSDLDWVAAIGVISDNATMSWLTFVREVFRRYRLRMPKDIKQSALGKISTMLSQAEAYSHTKAREAFKALYVAKSYKDIQGSELAAIAKVVDKEVEDQLSKHRKWCEADPKHDAMIGEVKSKYIIKSHITGELSAMYPKKTVVCYQKVQGDKVSISAWRKDGKVKMNTLLKRATRRLSGASAGGHDSMAGATIKQKDLETFKRQLIVALDAV